MAVEELHRRKAAPAKPEQEAPESNPGKPDAAEKATKEEPAAGPHARPGLTDNERTPGAGALPDPDEPKDQDATG
ncbi:hypothetical protein ABLE93_18715 [Xanthobacter sp. KR7-65]|uniref:hypothetical protein n=1 Tax=Xanthobacter sp. KR7-65 TaxID=3156612 RepID=UPI0032B4A844